MTVDQNDDMVPDTFKWTAWELEDLVEIRGSDKKGNYVEYMTPDGELVLGTRDYEEVSEESTTDLC